MTSLETRAVHVSAPPVPNSRPLSVPLYQASTFAFDDPDTLAAAMAAPDQGFAYSRYANPTTRALEDAVAGLEGGVAAVATASGMGAISTALLSVLGAGDHVLVQRCLYGGTVALLSDLSRRFGVEVTYLPGEDPAEVLAALRPNTRALYLETISNPLTRVVDLPGFLAAATGAGIVSIVDNTFATPLLCRPHAFGADVVLHSATKYLGGHSDVTGGILSFREEALHRSVWQHGMELGATPDPFAAWLTIRGLHTLPLRVRRHCANAAHLAPRLAAHPAVTRVHWPGLPDHRDHHATGHLSGHGGMLSFDLAGGREAGHRFAKSLGLIHLAGSLGGVETTVMHPASTSHRQLSDEELAAADIAPGTVRVSVGIEDPDDLWQDLAQALDA
ncbi:methionine-gamma-lyase [Crossiella equi]|uniref:Methionine-gamma-lyase n=1 Tax=Crossiella equi TaxID=130796 RepID=A0ABS5A8Q5_9PSEU|nr:aminotransferase class I/II-fold pyridoxal phosphate-dependent enzyme [Crossiella equi]MBP2472955.1 methionine-gamma-lyase [Crossiella equi]